MFAGGGRAALGQGFCEMQVMFAGGGWVALG